MSDKDPHLLAYEGIYEAWFAHMPDSSSRRKKMVREFADAASAPWRKRVEALTAEVEHLREKGTLMATTIQTGRATCVRCGEEFSIGTRERCPRVCDGGEHEAVTIHFFEPGRFDGLCAFPVGYGLMCGFPHGEAQIHTEIPPEVTILR